MDQKKARRRSSGSNKVVFSADVSEAKMDEDGGGVPRHTTGSNLFRTNTEVKDYLDSDVLTVKFRSIPRILTDDQKKNGAGPDTGITPEGMCIHTHTHTHTHTNTITHTYNRNICKMAS